MTKATSWAGSQNLQLQSSELDDTTNKCAFPNNISYSVRYHV